VSLVNFKRETSLVVIDKKNNQYATGETRDAQRNILAPVAHIQTVSKRPVNSLLPRSKGHPAYSALPIKMLFMSGRELRN